MTRFGALLLLLLAGGGVARADEALLPSGAMSDVKAVARTLAGRGRAEQMREALEILRAGGMDERSWERFEKDCLRRLQRSRHSGGAIPDAAERCRDAAREVAGRLGDLPEARRAAAAALALRLDDSLEAAHRALGHVSHQGGWVEASRKPRLERRAELEEAWRQARGLEVVLNPGSSDLTTMRRVYGKSGLRLQWRNVHAHSGDLPAAKLTRILGDALRACALSEFVRRRPLEIVEPGETTHLVFTGTREAYEAWIDAAREAERIDQETAAAARTRPFFDDASGYRIHAPAEENRAKALALFTLLGNQLYYEYRDFVQPALLAGHLHWLCETAFGVGAPDLPVTALPDLEGDDVPEDERLPLEPKVDMTAERQDLLHTARAGLIGQRAWLRHLVEWKLDPMWHAAFRNETAKIRGNTLFKAASVAQFLDERGELVRMLEATLEVFGDRRERYEGITRAWGRPLDTLEQEWRAWLAPPPRGLAQVLGGSEELEAERAEALRALEESRRASLLAGDADRCAALHADAELERSAPAEERSLRLDGAKDAEQALSRWLGEFDARVALLRPGLMHIGWTRSGPTLFLDAHSLVGPVDPPAIAIWPVDGARNVPLAYAAGAASPVKEAEATELGYPVTLQVAGIDRHVEPRLQLYKGKERRKENEVACHYLTPNAPIHAGPVPTDAFGLVPDRALEPNTIYSVHFDHPLTGEPASWTFRTAKG